ncbi:MAG: hypothetical protein N838_11535 [Thiohalocapsa sp. PB-PSB1]|nr:MAG: hypothetical protein N838_11535 [Thiohalocapsa sp. PB-PSB1]
MPFGCRCYIGIEISVPAQVAVAELNRVLGRLHASAVTNKDIAPLCGT